MTILFFVWIILVFMHLDRVVISVYAKIVMPVDLKRLTVQRVYMKDWVWKY